MWRYLFWCCCRYLSISWRYAINRLPMCRRTAPRTINHARWGICVNHYIVVVSLHGTGFRTGRSTDGLIAQSRSRMHRVMNGWMCLCFFLPPLAGFAWPPSVTNFHEFLIGRIACAPGTDGGGIRISDLLIIYIGMAQTGDWSCRQAPKGIKTGCGVISVHHARF